MSNVEFDVDKAEYTMKRSGVGNPSFVGGSSFNSSEPKMARWLMAKGLVKSANGAQGMLIAVVIINIIITFVVIKYFI